MLTALTVNDKTSKKWYGKIVNKIRGNKVEVEVKNARGVVLRHIVYSNRTGKIEWGKLGSIIGNQRNHLLCSGSIVFPKKSGFKRFESTEFKTRLASNLCIYILSQLEMKDIKVGLYDVKGQYTEILPYLVKYTSNLVVVTDNLTAFNYEVRNIYEEMGATVQLSNNRARLIDCKIVLAPSKIEELLPLLANTIIFSSAAPSVCTPGVVYYDYHFKMPNKFDRIKPQELSEEYFCGALYIKAQQYELGSIVPTACQNENFVQTYSSILDYLKKIVATGEDEGKYDENNVIST